MMERALLPVVRDGKTIYIVRHMPPSFRYLTRIDKNQCPLPNSYYKNIHDQNDFGSGEWQ